MRKAFLPIVSIIAALFPGEDATASSPDWEAYRQEVFPGPTAVRELGDDVFVHVRIPYDERRDRIRAKEAEARSVETDALLSHIAEKALARERERKPLPPEVARLSEIVLRWMPAWKSARLSVATGAIPSKTGPALTGDGALCTVRWFRKEDIDRAAESAAVDWGDAAFWTKALESIVEERWCRKPEDAFLASVGAPDAVWLVHADDVLLGAPTFIPAREFGPDEAGDADLRPGTPEEAAAEFSALRRELREWLRSPDSVAADFVHSAEAVLGPNVRTNVLVEGPFVRETTNVVVTVVTNLLAGSPEPVVSKRMEETEPDGTMPWRGEWRMKTVRLSGESVVTNISTTVVRSVEFRHVPAVVSETGTPAFEVAFLSAGQRMPERKPKSDVGAAAEAFFRNEQDPESRRMALETALRENPGDENLWNLLGRFYQERGEHRGAVVCFRCALRLDRLHPYAMVNMATSCAALGKPALARGFAILARGLAKDDWCRTHADEILLTP